MLICLGSAMYKVSRDSNHAEIVKELIQHDISVLDLSMVKSGCPDILIGFKTVMGSRVNVLVELKSSPKAVVRPVQQEFLLHWKGMSTICYNAESILYLCNYHGLKTKN